MARGGFALLLSGLLASPGLPAVDVSAVSAQIEVRIEPERRELAGRGDWTVPPGGPLRVRLNGRFDVTRFSVDGNATQPPAAGTDGKREWIVPARSRPQQIEIEWRGTLDPLDAALGHREVLGHASPATAMRGTFLPAAAIWHPVFIGRGLNYRLRIDLPASQRGIVPGRMVEERVDDDRRLQAFEFAQPDAAIDLMAGPYQVTERRYVGVDGRSIRLQTLFQTEVADLAPAYLEASERYLRRYERLIGPYPYDAFSVVSSPSPTGFGMPTLTYLGVDVLRLPFILGTSLGHEVLHNWWGNGVYPDYAKGNWSEGLTTFMADYAYREDAGPDAAREMRLGWLRDIDAVGSGSLGPLVRFTSRTDGREQVLGYGQAAMLFLMLRDEIGNRAFDEALQSFWREHRQSVASWADLEAAFAASSKRDLGAFFTQWLQRPGVPDVGLETARSSADGSKWRVEFTLRQSSPPWRLRVPVVVESGSRRETHWVDLTRERETFGLVTGARPDAISLDPDTRILRQLSPGEAPPILREVILDPTSVTVLAGATEAGLALAHALLEHPPRQKSTTVSPGAAPLLVIGLQADVDRFLLKHGLPPRPAELSAAPQRATAWVWTAARAKGGPVTVVAARDEDSLSALGRALPHYGRQSWLIFAGGTAIARGIWPSVAERIPLDSANGSGRESGANR